MGKQVGNLSVFYDPWSSESEAVISLFLWYSIGHADRTWYIAGGV